jgi:SAM-dependent methyltransferase
MERWDHFFPVFDGWLRELSRRKPVLDLGTFHGFRKELAGYEDLFPPRTYYSMDYHVMVVPGRRPPDVDGDICDLPFRSASVDGVICKDVLEHVEQPQRAIDEIFRVLSGHGAILATVPYLHPYHGSPSEKNRDLWRFTWEGVQWLFRRFSVVQIVPAGGLVFVAKMYAPARLRRALFTRRLAPVVNSVDRILRTRNATHMYIVWAEK